MSYAYGEIKQALTDPIQYLSNDATIPLDARVGIPFGLCMIARAIVNLAEAIREQKQ